MRGAVGTPLAVVAFVYAVWGAPWPTQPSFAPGAPSFGSAFDVPFTVTNKSAWFGIHDLTITCLLANFKAIGPTGATIEQTHGVTSTILPRGVNSVLAPLTTSTFTCPIGNALVVDKRNAGEQLVSASLSFMADYSGRLWWGRTQIISGVFSLDTATKPPQWAPGEPLR